MKPNVGSYVTQRDQRVGRAMRRSALAILVLASLVVAGVVWLSWPTAEGDVREAKLALPELRSTPRSKAPSVAWVEMTREAGITFHHQNGAKGEKLLPETMGSGCALFDYDGDGDADILFVNSRRWTFGEETDQPQGDARMALYRNDGGWHFEDVTTEMGLDTPLYGMGVAAGDMDNDGDADLFLTAVGSNRLYRNDGRTFVDVTASAGVSGDDTEWSTSCAWVDVNNDGRLDLAVGNYVRWSRQADLAQQFSVDGTSRAYGPPLAFSGTFPYLYLNEGDGRFRDASEEWGLRIRNPATGVPMAKTLGLAAVDLDSDGWMDLVLANDTVQNFVLHNVGGQRFEEIGATTGVAFDSMGQARGAMGIDAGWFRNDTTLGIAIGNFSNEMTALYVSMNEPLQFLDASVATGLGPITRLELTFGIFFFDYDLDGRLDVLAANGHLEQEIHKVQASQSYAQSPQLFWNAGPSGEAEFLKIQPEDSGSEFSLPMVGRGAAYADLDGDGDLDVVLTANGNRPRVLRNNQQLGHHWLRLRLKGEHANRDAIGARLRVYCDGQTLPRRVMPSRGYLSQSERTVTVGLGQHVSIEKVVIDWPDGSQQTVSHPELDREIEIIQKVR